MDKPVVSRRIPTRNFSKPVRCRALHVDGTLTTQSRRVSRLENALEDARESAGYSPYCTPRRVHQQLQDTDQRQNVYDRIEQRIRLPASSPTQVPELSSIQHQSAQQALQVFVDNMRRAAETIDEQDKFNLVRALAHDQSNFDSRILRPVSTARQQDNQADTTNQLDEITHWYSVGKEIGRGTFGRVRSATHRLSGTPVAVKSYARLHGARSCLAVDAIGKRGIVFSGGDALEWRRVRQEVNVLTRLRTHPNIMRFVEVFETPTRIHAVTELVRGKSLCDVLRCAPGQRLTETRAKQIFQQLAAAVEALHAQNVIHRDLKLENVLLDERSGHATVIDFGFSDFEEPKESPTTESADKKSAKKKNFCGTPSYMAPEVVASERYDGKPVDVWSLGIVLYVMLCGKFPFQGISFHQLYQKLRSGAQQLVLPPALSIEARSLLLSVLTFDPVKRPSATQLRYCSWLQYKEHPQFFQRNALSLSFESWPGTKQAICTALTELNGVQINQSDLDRAKSDPRQNKRLSAFIELAAVASCHHFQKIIASLPPPMNSSSCDDVEPQQKEEICIVSNEPQKSATDIRLSSTRHKQQLEKLIGLVKTSLATGITPLLLFKHLSLLKYPNRCSDFLNCNPHRQQAHDRGRKSPTYLTRTPTRSHIHRGQQRQHLHSVRAHASFLPADEAPSAAFVS